MTPHTLVDHGVVVGDEWCETYSLGHHKSMIDTVVGLGGGVGR